MSVAPRGHLVPKLGARQSFVAIFVLTIAVGTTLLWLPLASTPTGSAPFLSALFTATSATFVTGLTVVDTSTYWTGFGQVVIVSLIQIGGLGYMLLLPSPLPLPVRSISTLLAASSAP